MAPASGSPERASGATPPPSPTLAPRAWWRQEFRGEERQLGVLRRWLASLLPPCPARDDVVTVVDELGCNAIRHTLSGQGGRFTVEVTWYEAVVRVAVTDSGAATGPTVIDDPGGEHGRGLVVVRGLSVRWGVTGGRRGRIVWADVRWASAAAAVAAASPDGHEAAIRDGEAALSRRFAGVPAWFGRATRAWWALAGNAGLVSAPTAPELASLLYRLLDAQPSGQDGDAADAHQNAALPQPARQDRPGSASRRGPAPGTHPGPGTGTGHPGGPRGSPREAPGQARPALVSVLLTSGPASPRAPVQAAGMPATAVQALLGTRSHRHHVRKADR
jgi:serine/threonine-protein kinase RsbW